MKHRLTQLNLFLTMLKILEYIQQHLMRNPLAMLEQEVYWTY